jgi:hypothetical protein
MDTFGMFGFLFGMVGVVAFIQVTRLKKELDDLKKSLKDAGVLQDHAASQD